MVVEIMNWKGDIVARLEGCTVDGHDLSHVIDPMGDVQWVYCSRCDRRWRCEEA